MFTFKHYNYYSITGVIDTRAILYNEGVKVAVVGTGYVGLVTGTCMAEMGNDVICVDIDAAKVTAMKQGKIPIFEPGLEELFTRNIKEGRLSFSTSLDDALDAVVIFLALPTPPGEDGSADLHYILDVASDLGKKMQQYMVVVDKSTVPVGTAQKVTTAIAEHAKCGFDVVSNPEFLREGRAVDDFLRPDRVVIGSSSDRAAKIMRELYAPFLPDQPENLILTDEASAEMIKYAANAMLASRISFINELSQLCEATGADIEMVRQGIGSDQRIGPAFLHPGPGYGGSCFPKDTLALVQTAKDNGVKLAIVEATIAANEKQKQVLFEKVNEYFKSDLRDKTVALWGLAFKDNTDDIRESPAIAFLCTATSNGATVRAFDPEAVRNVKRQLGDLEGVVFTDDKYDALEDADALVIATEWKEFYNADLARIKKTLRHPAVFDGRNLYKVEDMERAGLHYQSIGRRVSNV